jgi:hypothetical protein
MALRQESPFFASFLLATSSQSEVNVGFADGPKGEAASRVTKRKKARRRRTALAAKQRAQPGRSTSP